jgi:hypothetical protein
MVCVRSLWLRTPHEQRSSPIDQGFFLLRKPKYSRPSRSRLLIRIIESLPASALAFWDDAQLTYKESEGLVKELGAIAKTLCGANGLEKTVGGVLEMTL